MTTCAEWLAEQYSEVSPWTFYRDLFPSGCLDKRDAKSKGKYCGIAVQIDGKKAMRYTLTDELDNLEDLISSDLFTVISPLSYAGKTQKAEYQREIYAIAIDLDNVLFDDGKPVGLANLISQIDRAGIIPKPTYVVASSPRNLHLYYLLEEPIKAFVPIKKSIAKYKEYLTRKIWNRYITEDHETPQIEPIGQSMRAVGTVCKDPANGRVRAFLTGDKVSVEYLNSFVGIDSGQEYSIVREKPGAKSKHKTGTGRKLWIAKNGLYEWWMRKMREGATVGHRYYCCLCAASFAKKSGVPYEQLRKDVLELVPLLDGLKEDERDSFTKADALAAIKNYKDPKFHTMRRDTLERLSGIPIPANKRNGQPQAIHLEILNASNAIKRKHGQPIGSPSKKEKVFAFMSDNPTATVRQVSKAVNCSVSTASKWMKEYRSKNV